MWHQWWKRWLISGWVPRKGDSSIAENRISFWLQSLLSLHVQLLLSLSNVTSSAKHPPESLTQQSAHQMNWDHVISCSHKFTLQSHSSIRAFPSDQCCPPASHAAAVSLFLLEMEPNTILTKTLLFCGHRTPPSNPFISMNSNDATTEAWLIKELHTENPHSLATRLSTESIHFSPHELLLRMRKAHQALEATSCPRSVAEYRIWILLKLWLEI